MRRMMAAAPTGGKGWIMEDIPNIGIELRQLRYFLVTAREENLRRAGEKLHVDQSALSRQIQGLEKHLGFALFERRAGRLVLSSAGRTYAEALDPLFPMLSGARERARRVASGEAGTLEIGFNELCTHYAPITDGLRQFREQFPDIQLNLSVLSTERQLAAFKSGRLDAAFGIGPQSPRHGLEFLPLVQDRFRLAMSPRHPLARRRGLTLADLTDEPMVQLTPSWRTGANILQEGNFSPKALLQVGSLDAVLGLVSAGLGVAFLAESLAPTRDRRIVFRTVTDFAPTLHLGLAWRSDRAPPAVRNFIEVLSAGRSVRRSPAR